MNTLILVISPDAPEPELIRRAADVLVRGQVIVIPTDTVYGIAQLVGAETNLEELRRVKQRPEEKNIPLLIASFEDLERYGKEVPDYAKELATRHWPGALTLVVRAGDSIPRHFVADDGSVALRMPAFGITLALLSTVQAPLACSSANLSGKAPATSLEELDPQVAGNVGLIVDGGSLTSGVASTVVSCLAEEPVVLRPGPITL